MLALIDDISSLLNSMIGFLIGKVLKKRNAPRIHSVPYQYFSTTENQFRFLQSHQTFLSNFLYDLKRKVNQYNRAFIVSLDGGNEAVV